MSTHSWGGDCALVRAESRIRAGLGGRRSGGSRLRRYDGGC